MNVSGTKALIVDDSRLARRELVALLADHPTIEVVGEAADVASALTLLNETKPDLLLLDIDLPDGSGFDLLEQADYTPRVIFTTAYEQHALHAFEVNALDYLLKPITAERLSQALSKVIQNSDTSPPQKTKVTNRKADDHLFIRDGERCHFVQYRDIRLLEVDGNYVRLYFRDTKAMLYKSLNYVEERLDPVVFFRANRKQIINLSFIANIEPWVGDGLLIQLQDGNKIEASRRQARELKQRLEI
jgi:two-component system, LytTR family, response regulator